MPIEPIAKIRIRAIGTSATCPSTWTPKISQPGPERDHGERGERREGGDERREDVEHVDGRAGEEALLPDELHHVGDRLQEPERAGAVRPVAELHPPHHLPLGQRQIGEGADDEVDDDHAT